MPTFRYEVLVTRRLAGPATPKILTLEYNALKCEIDIYTFKTSVLLFWRDLGKRKKAAQRLQIPLKYTTKLIKELWGDKLKTLNDAVIEFQLEVLRVYPEVSCYEFVISLGNVFYNEPTEIRQVRG
jgi:hypothetical protein